MGLEKQIIELEKKIRGKMCGIKNKTILPKDSNIGVLFKHLKEKDVVLYERLIEEYKNILKDL